MAEKGALNRYSQIIERIFLAKYKTSAESVAFDRSEIETAAAELGIALPKNLGDIIYSFRFRSEIPERVRRLAPEGKTWIIRLVGKGRYCFVANTLAVISPRPDLAATKVPDSTPGIIDKYALTDEQALLAKLRYNRLIDIFTGVACYSLQSHLRTSVRDVGQVETDEIYIGVDKRGAQFVFPVQAKGGKDKQSVVQIEQDFAICREKFPALICRPIAAQFMRGDVIALFEFEQQDQRIEVSSERHYRLVPQEEVSVEDLNLYRQRT